jgi:hypothetical protein
MRKIVFLVLLLVVALAPVARAQAPRGYYDQYGRYHEYSNDDGYYDRNGQWHPNDSNDTNGYYDSQGVWHPNATASGNGYYDRNGVWHSYGNDRNDRYDRAVGPDRWTWSDNRGRAESLATAARNFSLTAASVNREAYRRSQYSDRAALDALRQLDERAQYFARQVESNRVQSNRVQSNRGNGVGRAYADVVDSYLAVRSRFAAVAPDAWLSNQFHVMSAALGRIDKRFFGSRAFGGQLPDQGGYDQSYGYDRYGNPLPGYDRDGRSTRPYPY